MAVQLFGAIDVGSYEIALTINECSKKNGVRVIDQVSHRINLGSDTFLTGKISCEHVAELKKLLFEYRRIMDDYGVKEYKAYGTSAIREMVNATLVLNEIEQQTGIHIDVLSNSEQRFLDYKSIAAKTEGFAKIIDKGTAIVDIGGSSIQISLFDKDRLVTTENMKLGVLRLYDQIRLIDAGSSRRDYVVEELVNSQLRVFQHLYMNERKIRNLIIVDDYISPMMQNHMTATGEPGVVDVHAFLHFMESLRSINTQELARKLGIADDNIPLLYVSGMLLQCIIRMMNCELLWAPGVTLCDGIVYDHAVQNRFLQPAHDFEEDIVACARNIAKRYMGLPERGSVIENISLKIFDETKKYHGMGQRERLLLRIAALLHDCGKYISMVNAGECAYNVIMSTEIIGLSHIEREIVANVVKYNHSTFEYYGMKKSTTDLDREAYIVITKLTAILRIANGLDRSHTQKCNDVRISVRDQNMIITVNTSQDLTMEKGLFAHRADFFEEVFGIRPVIKRKK